MSTTTNYAQLNIGRNYGTDRGVRANTPMLEGTWSAFIMGAKMRLAAATIDPKTGRAHQPDATIDIARNNAQVHTGTGEWDGVAEESAHVSLYWEHGIDVDLLERMACALATNYH